MRCSDCSVNNPKGPATQTTPNRRRGQALIGLIVGGAEAPGSATTTPLVNLVIGQKILENFLERYLHPDTPAVPVDRDDPDYRCERIDGTPIHPDLAFVATAVAEFERIVLDERSRVIDMSVKARGFPDWMKRALLVTARGRCRTRGCDSVWPCFASPTRVCRPANSPTRRWIRRCLPKANSGLPDEVRQNANLARQRTDPSMFAAGKLGFAGQRPAKRQPRSPTDRSFDVCRRQTRVCRATPGKTVIRTTNGSAISWPDAGKTRASPPLNLEN